MCVSLFVGSLLYWKGQNFVIQRTKTGCRTSLLAQWVTTILLLLPTLLVAPPSPFGQMGSSTSRSLQGWPTLVTSGKVGLPLLLPYTGTGTSTGTALLKVSTELTRIYTRLYSALLHLTEPNLSSHGFCGSTIGTSGIVWLYSYSILQFELSYLKYLSIKIFWTFGCVFSVSKHGLNNPELLR